MRAVAGLVLVIATAWPSTLGQARDRATGPPETMASERAVTSNVPVESEFPIDFLGVLYEGDVEGGAVRFRHGGRWGSWVKLHDDGAEVADHWASGLVPGSDADLVVLDENGAVRDVMARGRWHVREGRAVIRGTFET